MYIICQYAYFNISCIRWDIITSYLQIYRRFYSSRYTVYIPYILIEYSVYIYGIPL